ncbi:MAG: lipocalin-like domain-containing protein [Gammaproteobacteria bacterium]
MKTSVAALLGTLVLPTSIHAEAGNEELYGTWRLVSYAQTIVATGETTEIFGKAPRGFVNYGRDGRMMVLIVKDERPKPADLAKMTDQERAELFKTLVAYGGTYTRDAKTITHHLDISWNEIWTGTDQVRNVKFDGRKVILSTNPQPRSQDGKVAISIVTWEKLE